MITLDITRQRLHNQLITYHAYEKPDDVVRWLGAVQAQDFAAARWALGQRMTSSSDDAIEQAFARGDILRTHLMRPTWHFVAADDIRWLLALTAPRVQAGNAFRNRQLELDEATLLRSNALMQEVLQGGQQLTRGELESALQRAGIATDGQRIAYFLMRAELDGIICSGARRDKQVTYALLDERVPPSRILERDEALAELTKRYFTSHGPATLQDFVWWSGLTMADARAGLAMMTPTCMQEIIEGQTYWFTSSAAPEPEEAREIHLLPNYDEYLVAYTDRSAIFDAAHTTHLDARSNILFNHTIVMHGRIIGTWKRTLKKDSVVITPLFFTPLDEAAMDAFIAAANRYGAFLGLPVTIVNM